MEQSEISQLQRALDLVQSLSVEEQETLIELVQHRLAEWRRTQIARNAAATLQAVREGRAQFGSVDDLKRDLLDES